jgi:hypothetical protein
MLFLIKPQMLRDDPYSMCVPCCCVPSLTPSILGLGRLLVIDWAQRAVGMRQVLSGSRPGFC